MKILFLSHYSGLLGSNRSLLSVVKYFKEKNIIVSVLLPSKGDFYHYLKNEGIETQFFKFFYETLYIKNNKKYLSLPLLWIYNFLTFPFLLYKISKIRPDVIYTNSSSDLYSIAISNILKIRHVVHVREFMEEDFGAYCIFGKKIKKKIILKSDKIIFVSQAVANSVVGEIPNYGRVIYNGLSLPKNNYNYCGVKNNFRIAVVGNLDISKQQHLAILFFSKILAKYPNMTLHIIGDKNGSYKKSLLNLVQYLNISNNVVFEGFIKDTEEIYSKFDILFMCSRSEAFGRVTIEAMLRHKLVIGFCAGGTKELIEHGINGFLFKDINDVIKALDIISTDNKRGLEITTSANQIAKSKYSEINYIKNVYNFIIEEQWTKK